MSQQITVNFDTLPPSPNKTRESTHWASRARIDKEWRELAHWVGRQARGIKELDWTAVGLSATFYLPDRRRRDPGNLVGSEGFKALIDGLVDARIMVDDSTEVIREYGPFAFELRRGEPGVSVTITRME